VELHSPGRKRTTTPSPELGCGCVASVERLLSVRERLETLLEPALVSASAVCRVRLWSRLWSGLKLWCPVLRWRRGRAPGYTALVPVGSYVGEPSVFPVGN
jgi:hypothetical protein